MTNLKRTVVKGKTINAPDNTVSNVNSDNLDPTDIEVFDGLINHQSAITYASSVTVDLAHADNVRTIALTGNITFNALSNKAAGREKVIILTSDGSSRTLAFPSWTWIGSAAPTALAASKTMVIYLYSSGTTEAGVLASYSVQP